MNEAETFDLYDFREDSEWMLQDRRDFESHKKVIEGLLAFEGRRLGDKGYGDLRAGLQRDLQAKQRRAVVYAIYLERSIKNAVNYLRWKYTKKFSLKVDNEDSITSSWLGYSQAYELISSFVSPTWFGWCDGKLRKAPVILHHLQNMLILMTWLEKWDAKEILEFGSGSGVNLLLLQRICEGGQDLSLSGFDYSDARVLTARATIEHFGLNIRNLFLANGLSLPFQNGSFDVVFSHYVIEQMKGYEERALDEMLRVSRKGVIMFESATLNPTFDQRIFMKHSGYSHRMSEVVLGRPDSKVQERRNLKKDRFFGGPNVLMVLEKS